MDNLFVTIYDVTENRIRRPGPAVFTWFSNLGRFINRPYVWTSTKDTIGVIYRKPYFRIK